MKTGSPRERVARITAIYGLPLCLTVDDYLDLPITALFTVTLRDGRKIILYCRQSYERRLGNIREDLIARTGECTEIVTVLDDTIEEIRTMLTNHTVDAADTFSCLFVKWAVVNGTYRYPWELAPTEKEIAEVMVAPSPWRNPDAEPEIEELCKRYGFQYIPPQTSPTSQ